MADNPLQPTEGHWGRGRSPPIHGDYTFSEEIAHGHRSAYRERVRGTKPLGLSYRKLAFPTIEKVTGLFLPRHFYRDIEWKVLDELITQSFPNVYQLTYERWPESSNDRSSSYKLGKSRAHVYLDSI